MSAIKELNYHPDISARSFKTGKKYTVGLIVPNIGSGFFASFIEDTEAILQQKKYRVIISNTHEDEKLELENIKFLCSGMVDGLIICSSTKDYETIKPIIKSKKIPVVFVERSSNHCPFDSVMISDYNSTSNSIEYLIENGHTKIGFIYGSASISPLSERINAYIDTMNKYGIEINSSFIKEVQFNAFEATKSLIESGCTAIVSSTNRSTIDSILYCINNNISIKNDINLIGYLNDDYESTNLTKIPVVLHPIKDMASQAVKLIINRINNIDSPVKNVILLSKFVKPIN